MSKTRIEWADAVWNPVTGCSKVSEGCDNCYAERMSKRLAGRCGYPAANPFKVTFHEDRLGDPLRWRKPKRIFVCSMGDLFHDDVPDEFIARIWWVMGQCAGYLDPSRHRPHTFLVLTKRASRMKDWIRGWCEPHTRKRWVESFGAVYDWESGPRYWPDVLPNVWLGVTAENQETADKRIPMLLQIPAAVRFVSCEPLLGPVGLAAYISNGIQWVIVGGESGPDARTVHPDWVRSIRDQCIAAEVPFLFKQWGEWCYPEQMPEDAYRAWDVHYGTGDYHNQPFGVGKKAAGRELDSRIWDEYPK
jgi:protein gp37